MNGRILAYVAIALAVLSLALAFGAHASIKRNPECYIKNPPKQVQWSYGRVIGTMQSKCAARVKVLGTISCLQRENLSFGCVANVSYNSASNNAVASHICQYTTYGYIWRVSGYSFVTYYNGEQYTSLTYSSPPIFYRCH